ncbi:hypothetical protein AWB80_08172 [Caballeronia pedi]|uniref:Uncharacterized protein n=2 Tax=Caballeronia pedi TaxID=1777141 RepID=A0A158E5C4_9BURK|nr:hypothetical protein AWB80_08172 [Caballeronia pedi]
MRIHISFGPTRKKPRVGDRRTTKKHGTQVRVMKMARDGRGNIIGHDCTGGRQLYEWVSLEDAAKQGNSYLLTREERDAIESNQMRST